MAAAKSSGRKSRLLRPYTRDKNQQRQLQMMGSPVGFFQLQPPLVARDRTMQQFPVHAAAAVVQPAQERSAEMKKTPMTIFYSGQVITFDHFPAERAKQLMQMAQSLSASPPKVMEHVPGKPEVGEPSVVADPYSIARKASLQRFLKKRKYRISGTSPDHDEDGPPSKRIDAAGGEPMGDVPDALWRRL